MTDKELRRQYSKTLSTLKTKIKRYEKRGYILPNDIIPKKPETITLKDIEKLVKIRSNIKSKTTGYKTKTGDIVTSKTGRQIEKARKKTKQESSSVDYVPEVDIIEKIKERLSSIPDVRYFAKGVILDTGHYKNFLSNLLDDTAIEMDGLGKLAQYQQYLIDNTNLISEMITIITYDSKDYNVTDNFYRLSEIINGGMLNFDEAQKFEDFTSFNR